MTIEKDCDGLPTCGLFMKPREFQDWASISPSTFYREIERGNLSLTKIGRASRVSVSEARRWASNLMTIGGADA